MSNTADLKESEQKDVSRNGKTYRVKNLRLHVVACVAAAAVGIFAAVVGITNLPFSTDGDTIASLSTNQEVAVTGQCNETEWYRIEFDGETAYVNDMFLSEIKVEVHE